MTPGVQAFANDWSIGAVLVMGSFRGLSAGGYKAKTLIHSHVPKHPRTPNPLRQGRPPLPVSSAMALMRLPCATLMNESAIQSGFAGSSGSIGNEHSARTAQESPNGLWMSGMTGFEHRVCVWYRDDVVVFLGAKTR
jgi:hypothetical protein